MKFFKKFVPVFLSISLFSTYPVLASSNIPGLDIAQEDVFVGIKKIEKENNELKSKDVKNPSNIRDLEDGTYVLNRGTGWIINEEENFLTSSIVKSGTSSNIETSKSVSVTHTAITGVSSSLDFEFVKTSLELTYEHSISNEDTISASFDIEAPSDKDLYVKLYSTHSRYDTIEVKDGKIIEHSATYIPEGTWAKVIENTPGEHLNLSKFEEKVTRCVLGENPLDNIKNNIEINGVTNNQTKSFNLYLDYNSEEILFSNRTNTPIHEGYGNQEYFKFKLLNPQLEEKLSFELNGTDNSKDDKYNNINGVNFQVGDFIQLEHLEPFRIAIYDYDGNNVNLKYSKKMLFKITESGLKQTDENGNELSEVSSNVSSEDTVKNN
ncbi:MAG: enterotoxin [Lachnospirales bacterium]